MTTFVNLTGHTVSLLGTDRVDFEPSGTVIRLKEKELDSSIYNDSVKVKTIEYETSGEDSWPPQRPDTYYIVSYIIAKASQRPDFIFPFDMVRKPGGVIVGCRSFGRVPTNGKS